MGMKQTPANVGRMIGRGPVSGALEILRTIDRVLSQGAVDNARDAMTEAANRRDVLRLLAIERTSLDDNNGAEVHELRERVPQGTQTGERARIHTERSTAGSE